MPATILCAQADRAACDLHVDALEAEGYQTLTARDGQQALDLLKRQSPDFVVLDVALPRQNGLEILAQLRALRPDESVPVLMVSNGEATSEVVAQAEALGAIGVLAGPVSADQLVAKVADFAKPTDAGGTAPVPDRGTLKQVPFPELMHGLHVNHFDGVLLVEHGRKKKAIEFREGWPICVKSNLVSECLGNYLIRTMKCTKEQIAESIERMKTGEGLQGEILIAMEVLDEEGVIAALEEHALEKLYEVFSWKDGSFLLRSGVRIQRGSSIAIEGHPSNITVQGVRRQTPLVWVDRFIARHEKSFLVPSGTGSEGGLECIDLAPDEVEWIRGLDGSFELGALAEKPESMRRLVLGLLSVEIFRVEAAAGSADAARSATRGAGEAKAARRFDASTDDELRSELARLANRMQGADHYAVLDVSSFADDDEIRTAYEGLCEQTGAERFHGASGSVRQLAAKVFDRIEKAYAGIATADAREAYSVEQAESSKSADIEDEGRRALRAETEFQKGETLMAKREYESALACFGRAMESFPSEGEYRAHYGWCLHLCHPDNEVMLAEALEHCRQGVKLAKDREKPYLLLGRLYKVMGKAEAAKKMFARAVQIKPRCVEAMRELRIMNMRRGKDKGVLKRLFRR